MAAAKEEEKKKMDDLKKEVSMDEHIVDVKVLCARLKTDTEKVSRQHNHLRTAERLEFDAITTSLCHNVLIVILVSFLCLIITNTT